MKKSKTVRLMLDPRMVSKSKKIAAKYGVTVEEYIAGLVERTMAVRRSASEAGKISIEVTGQELKLIANDLINSLDADTHGTSLSSDPVVTVREWWMHSQRYVADHIRSSKKLGLPASRKFFEDCRSAHNQEAVLLERLWPALGVPRKAGRATA